MLLLFPFPNLTLFFNHQKLSHSWAETLMAMHSFLRLSFFIVSFAVIPKVFLLLLFPLWMTFHLRQGLGDPRLASDLIYSCG